jgi:membrane associated rhomboid family serine protease
MLGTWLLPGIFGDVPVVGASAGGAGLIAAFAVLYPRQQLFLLLFMIIPLKMRATTLLWVLVVSSLVGIVVPYGNMAHAAHLGGVAMGFLYTRGLLRRHRPPPPIIETGGKSSLNINPAPD